MRTVAIIGASEKPERASNSACRLLIEHGHAAIAISPHGRDIHGAQGATSYADLEQPIDTVTLYIGPARQSDIIDQLIAAPPKRVIFNPGTESDESQSRLEDANIEVIVACTLVMLQLNQF